MKRQLAKLLEIRNIIALATVALFLGLSAFRVLQTDFIQNVILTVIIFFFAKGVSYDDVSKKEDDKK